MQTEVKSANTDVLSALPLSGIAVLKFRDKSGPVGYPSDDVQVVQPCQIVEGFVVCVAFEE